MGPSLRRLQPARTALLVIDMQRDFLDPGGYAAQAGLDISRLRQAITPIRALLAAARHERVSIAHTREGHLPDLSDCPPIKLERSRAAGAPIGSEGPLGRLLLRGEYGRYRANNDLLHYALTVRVDPDRRFLSGRNSVRFRMLEDDTRIQLDLYDNLAVDRILHAGAPITYERVGNAVYVDFPRTLSKGETYEVEVHYSGTPLEKGRFGGIAFRKDPDGQHWINTACEGEGSSIWWPSKDQWRDEPEGMDLSVEIPSHLAIACHRSGAGRAASISHRR